MHSILYVNQATLCFGIHRQLHTIQLSARVKIIRNNRHWTNRLIFRCTDQLEPHLSICCRHIFEIGFVREIVIDTRGYVKLQILCKGGWLAIGEVLGFHFPIIDYPAHDAAVCSSLACGVAPMYEPVKLIMGIRRVISGDNVAVQLPLRGSDCRIAPSSPTTTKVLFP